MKRTGRSAMQSTWTSEYRLSGLCVALLLVCCGGKSASVEIVQVAGAGGSDSSAAASGSSNAAGAGGVQSTNGGAATTGGSGIIILGGSGGELAGGGASSYAGAAGADETPCDVAQLVTFIVQGGIGAGQCQLAGPPGPGEMTGIAHGAVVLDADGRVIDNTGLSANAKQAWLIELSAQRWTCLAGQTVGYRCTPGG